MMSLFCILEFWLYLVFSKDSSVLYFISRVSNMFTDLRFYPPNGIRKQNRRWSNCFYFPFNSVLETDLTLSKYAAEIGLFEILKMF